MKKVGYLGPPGTFTEAAAYQYVGTEEVELVCCASLPEIVTGVEEGSLDRGVVPLESSIEGAVNQILDLVAKSKHIKFCGEVLLTISHCLLTKPGTKKEEIKRILSHPQALAQCRDYLNREFPGHQVEETPSTSQAVSRVAQCGGDQAAIGTEMAAAIYGLKVMDSGIQDVSENVTRFIVLGSEDAAYSSFSRTSLVVEAKDRPGALYSILREFTLREINLTKIESRPVKKKLGQYLFFIDLDGHRSDPGIASAIENLSDKMQDIKILGSYPKASLLIEQEPEEKEQEPITLNEMRAEIDLVDSQIVELIGMRTRMVRKIGILKGDATKVKDPGREDAVIHRVRELAVKKDADPDTIESVYRTIIYNSVALQKKELKGS